MIEIETEIPTADEYVEILKSARHSTATLKLKLASLRSELPNLPIFVFEGPDDKIVYFQWIRRTNWAVQYEPFPCEGKELVLNFRKSLSQDLKGLKKSVYFFVDRDFDDLAGHASGPDIFMPEMYSVENYLSTELVLVELLKNELHCDGAPKTREVVLTAFRERLAEFVDIVRNINLRLYTARRLKIELKCKIPDKIGHIANVELMAITQSESSPADIIQFSSEPSKEEADFCAEEFLKLHETERYRGKFYYMFFFKWVSLLAEDRNTGASAFFRGLSKRHKVKTNELSLGMMASKSAIPQGLAEFLRAVT